MLFCSLEFLLSDFPSGASKSPHSAPPELSPTVHHGWPGPGAWGSEPAPLTCADPLGLAVKAVFAAEDGEENDGEDADDADEDKDGVLRAGQHQSVRAMSLAYWCPRIPSSPALPHSLPTSQGSTKSIVALALLADKLKSHGQILTKITYILFRLCTENV